jgi:hypothetical protein
MKGRREIKVRNGLKKGRRELRDGDPTEVFSSRAKYCNRMVEYSYSGIQPLFIPVHNPLKLNSYFRYQQV